MYRSLLVPLDGSTFAEQALPVALGIARRAGATVEVATVVTHHWIGELLTSESSAQLVAVWRTYLTGIVERVQRDYGVSMTCVVLEGSDVAGTLCAHATKIAADLVVMSTHGRGTLGHLWFGSVAYDVIHRMTMPILYVRPGHALTAWGHELAFQHTLVAVDGSLVAENALEPALAMCKLMDADCTLLRVINEIPFGTPELDSISLDSLADGLIEEIESVQNHVKKEAQKYLDAIAGRIRGQGFRVTTRIVTGLDPGKAILDTLSGTDFDLVALETRGQHDASDRLLGSVARKIIHGTHVPVLVQPANTTRN